MEGHTKGEHRKEDTMTDERKDSWIPEVKNFKIRK